MWTVKNFLNFITDTDLYKKIILKNVVFYKYRFIYIKHGPISAMSGSTVKQTLNIKQSINSSIIKSINLS